MVQNKLKSRNFAGIFRKLSAHFTQHSGIGTSSAEICIWPIDRLLAHAAPLGRCHGRSPRPAARGRDARGLVLVAAFADRAGRGSGSAINVARFRLYRLRFLQENMRFAAFFKIYQILKLKFLKFDKILQILRR